MINIFLDPFFFSCPKASDGIEKLESYINNIISLKEVKDCSWADIYTSVKTIDVLMESNSYPILWDELRALVSELGLIDVSIKDIISLVDSFIQKNYLEDAFKIDDILIDAYECAPDCNLNNRLSSYKEHFESLSILVCLINELYGYNLKDQIILTSCDCSDTISVQVRGQIIEIESNVHNLNLPHSCSGEIILCTDTHGLYSSVDSSSVWKQDANEQAYKEAILIQCYQWKNDGSGQLDNSESWIFGPQFLKTVEGCGILPNLGRVKALLRACEHTINKQNLTHTHALRINNAGNSPQVTRANGDRAWRRDIDYEYHLHYWESPFGLELASVVVHNNMTIPA